MEVQMNFLILKEKFCAKKQEIYRHLNIQVENKIKKEKYCQVVMMIIKTSTYKNYLKKEKNNKK